MICGRQLSTVPRISQKDLQKYDRIENDTMVTYLIGKQDGYCQMVGYDGEYEYLICGSDYDVLVKILSAMKGIDK